MWGGGGGGGGEEWVRLERFFLVLNLALTLGFVFLNNEVIFFSCFILKILVNNKTILVLYT